MGVNRRANPNTGMWRARMKVDGKMKHLGMFICRTAAQVARKQADTTYGFTARHGV